MCVCSWLLVSACVPVLQTASACVVTISRCLGIVASGARDGTVLIHDLNTFRVATVINTAVGVGPSPYVCMRSRVCVCVCVSGCTCACVFFRCLFVCVCSSECACVCLRTQGELESSVVTGLFISESCGRIVAVVCRTPLGPATPNTLTATVQTIQLYSLSGVFLQAVDCTVPLVCAALTSGGDFLLCGDAHGSVAVLSLGDLTVVHTYAPTAAGIPPTPGGHNPSISAVVPSDNDRHLFVAADFTPLLVRPPSYCG